MPESRSRSKRKRRSYAPPPPKKKRKPSPRWYGVLILGVMVVGVVMIVINYMGLIPGTGRQADPKYLWLGLAIIALGFGGLTQLR